MIFLRIRGHWIKRLHSAFGYITPEQAERQPLNPVPLNRRKIENRPKDQVVVGQVNSSAIARIPAPGPLCDPRVLR
jgi:hypothetical protein